MEEGLEDSIRETANNYSVIADSFDDRTRGMQIEDIEEFIELVKNRKENPSVLDVGCGPGRDARTFAEEDIEVTGIDLSEKMLDRARKGS